MTTRIKDSMFFLHYFQLQQELFGADIPNMYKARKLLRTTSLPKQMSIASIFSLSYQFERWITEKQKEHIL